MKPAERACAVGAGCRSKQARQPSPELRVAEMCKVSIIVPNYNYGRFLKERIRSVLKQTWTDFELLYVDDGSSDESNYIAQAFQGEPRVRLRLCKKNSGTVYQRWNEAAQEASGE